MGILVVGFSLSGCRIEEGIDYEGGPNNVIVTKYDLLQSKCAELAAATVGGLYWTWKKNSGNGRRICLVRKTNYHRTSPPTSHTKIGDNPKDVVSGNRACGLPRKDSLLMNL